MLFNILIFDILIFIFFVEFNLLNLIKINGKTFYTKWKWILTMTLTHLNKYQQQS